MKKPRIYLHLPLSGQIPANLPPNTRIVRVETGLTFSILLAACAWGTEERDAIMAKDLAELGAHDTKEEPGWGVDALAMVSGQWLHMTIPGYTPKKKRPAHVAADWTLAASERQEQGQAA